MTMRQWGPETLTHLLKFETIGEMLFWLCNQNTSTDMKPKIYSYAEIARLLEYKSRSFIREVAEKKSKPNIQLVNRFVRYFKLNASWKKYFEFLCRREVDSDSKLDIEISIQRNKLSKQIAVYKTEYEVGKNDYFVNSPLIPVVYSALGSQENGATIEEMQNRTHLSEVQIQSLLEVLIDKKSVFSKNGKFFAKNNQVLIERCHNENVFVNDLNWNIKNLQNRINHKKISSDELLYLSTYSISQENLPNFKQRLSALLTEFSTDTESPDGDAIVNLSAFLTLN